MKGLLQTISNVLSDLPVNEIEVHVKIEVLLLFQLYKGVITSRFHKFCLLHKYRSKFHPVDWQYLDVFHLQIFKFVHHLQLTD